MHKKITAYLASEKVYLLVQKKIVRGSRVMHFHPVLDDRNAMAFGKTRNSFYGLPIVQRLSSCSEDTLSKYMCIPVSVDTFNWFQQNLLQTSEEMYSVAVFAAEKIAELICPSQPQSVVCEIVNAIISEAMSVRSEHAWGAALDEFGRLIPDVSRVLYED